MVESHVCKFRRDLQPEKWRTVAPGRRERLGRFVSRCETCGKVRDDGSKRPWEWKEEEADAGGSGPRSGQAREVAAVLLSQAVGGSMPGTALLAAVERRGVGRSDAHGAIQELLAAGWIRVAWWIAGERNLLAAIEMIGRAPLARFVSPTDLAAADRVAEAADEISRFRHPLSPVIAHLLRRVTTPETEKLSDAFLALARMLEEGGAVPAREFCKSHIGDPTLRDPFNRIVEQQIGPLDSVGLFEADPVVLIGGGGAIHVRRHSYPIAAFGALLGVEPGAIDQGRIEIPEAGLEVIDSPQRLEESSVERLRVVVARALPRALKRLCAIAAASRRPVIVRCGVSLEGVRLARCVATWSGVVPSVPAFEASLPPGGQLPLREGSRIRLDLDAQPAASWTEVLAAIIKRKRDS